jgi:GTP-binding protein
VFIDTKQLRVSAGKGGDGAALFRREKYVPYGGPDGGDGGRGGDVIVRAVHNIHALNHLMSVDRIEAEAGQNGAHQRKTGRSGEYSEILVPLGTEVWEAETNTLIVELTEDNQTHVLARGGNGGWGNWHFKSSRQQTPERANPGLPGETVQVRFLVKLIADVGLIGLPNAGKSTFLSVVSAATPKIADYPFTTLEPQLGVAQLDGNMQTLVIADLPGLIEGASSGKGLGTTFLRHVERTKVLLHLVDASVSVEELCESYSVVRNELIAWSEALAGKPVCIALSKCELVDDAELQEKKQALEKVSGMPVHIFSAVTREGLRELLFALAATC